VSARRCWIVCCAGAPRFILIVERGEWIDQVDFKRELCWGYVVGLRVCGGRGFESRYRLRLADKERRRFCECVVFEFTVTHRIRTLSH
jgi:hypothetical protein